jgi:hypothetical protein
MVPTNRGLTQVGPFFSFDRGQQSFVDCELQAFWRIELTGEAEAIRPDLRRTTDKSGLLAE